MRPRIAESRGEPCGCRVDDHQAFALCVLDMLCRDCHASKGHCFSQRLTELLIERWSEASEHVPPCRSVYELDHPDPYRSVDGEPINRCYHPQGLVSQVL